jgi:hypothetical protein
LVVDKVLLIMIFPKKAFFAKKHNRDISYVDEI